MTQVLQLRDTHSHEVVEIPYIDDESLTEFGKERYDGELTFSEWFDDLNEWYKSKLKFHREYVPTLDNGDAGDESSLEMQIDDIQNYTERMFHQASNGQIRYIELMAVTANKLNPYITYVGDKCHFKPNIVAKIIIKE